MADSEEANGTIEYLTVEMICRKKKMSIKSGSTVLAVLKRKCKHKV